MDYYLPAAAAFQKRTAGRGALCVSLLKWKQDSTQHWAALRFGKLHVESSARNHSPKVEVHLGELHADSLHVELYATSIDGGSPFVSAMPPL